MTWRPIHIGRSIFVFVSLFLLVAALAACNLRPPAHAEPIEGEESPTPTPVVSAPTPVPTVGPTATPVPTAEPTPTPPPPPTYDAAMFRTDFNMALQEHSYLLAEAAYAHVTGRQEHASVVRDLLQKENTPLIRDQIGIAFSLDRRDAFATAWHEWTNTVLAYADAHHVGNSQRAHEIWRDRFRIAGRLHAPFTGLTQADQSVLRRAVEQHVELTLSMVSNMHSKPAIDGYWHAWHTSDFLRPIGNHISEAVVRQVPHRFDEPRDGRVLTSQSSAATLQAELALLLHEYGLLLMNMTAAGIDGRSVDAVAAMETMDVRNSMPLAEIIGSYDPTKEALFLENWRQHVYAVNRFTNAVRANDERSKEIAQGELYGVMSDMAELLVKLSPNMNRAAVEEALHWHADQIMAAIVAQSNEAVDHRYVASIAMARKSQVLAGVLEEALLAQFPERTAVEDTIYDLVRTWNSGNVDSYMAFWTDGAIEQRFGVTRVSATQHLDAQAGTPRLWVSHIRNVDVSNGEAVVEWDAMAGTSLKRFRTTLVNDDGRWLISRSQALDSPIPPGINALVPVRVTDNGYSFNRSLIDGGYVAFRMTNERRDPIEIVLVRLAHPGSLVIEGNGMLGGVQHIATTGAIQPGRSANVSFAVPLDRGQYALVAYRVSAGGGQPEVIRGMVSYFAMPYQPGVF